MIKTTLRYFLFLLLLSNVNKAVASDISGKILLDTTWHSEIYLSQLNSFDELNLISDDLIISAVAINPDGTFSFSNFPLLNEDRIFRLHVRKKGDPLSTIIIGGREQNHIHFILRRDKSVQFQPNGQSLFLGMSIEGYSANKTLGQLQGLNADFRSNKGNSQRALELLAVEYQRKLKLIADTTTNLLAALFTIEELKRHSEFEELAPWLEAWLIERESVESIYLENLKREYQFHSFNQDSSQPWWAAGFAVMILIGLAIYFKSKRGNSKLGSLTVKERQVFEHLKEGMSNKEIAAKMNVEQSTIKSHVNNIFSKLKIKSRNQILDY